MIEPIVSAALAVQSNLGDFVNNTAKENAKRTAGRISKSSAVIPGLACAGELKIAVAIYDLKTGIVTFLD